MHCCMFPVSTSYILLSSKLPDLFSLIHNDSYIRLIGPHAVIPSIAIKMKNEAQRELSLSDIPLSEGRLMCVIKCRNITISICLGV